MHDERDACEAECSDRPVCFMHEPVYFFFLGPTAAAAFVRATCGFPACSPATVRAACFCSSALVIGRSLSSSSLSIGAASSSAMLALFRLAPGERMEEPIVSSGGGALLLLLLLLAAVAVQAEPTTAPVESGSTARAAATERSGSLGRRPAPRLARDVSAGFLYCSLRENCSMSSLLRCSMIWRRVTRERRSVGALLAREGCQQDDEHTHARTARNCRTFPSVIPCAASKSFMELMRAWETLVCRPSVVEGGL